MAIRLLNDMEKAIYLDACRICHVAGRDSPLPSETGRILDLAYAAGARWRASWNSWSGTDRVDGEVYREVERCYMAIARGVEVETAISDQDRSWRAFAAENNAKVDQAPKITRGGSAGLSVISHRWTSPDRFATMARHIRDMIIAAAEALSAEVIGRFGED